MGFPLQVAIAGAVALATANTALAEAFLCQGTASAGLHHANDEWTPTTFRGDTLVIRSVPRTSGEAEVCHIRAESLVADAYVFAANSVNEPSCYAVGRIGEPSGMHSCVRTKRDGEFFWLDCDGMTTFRMNNELRYFRSADYSALYTTEPEEGRDDIYVSVGKCSVIE